MQHVVEKPAGAHDQSSEHHDDEAGSLIAGISSQDREQPGYDQKPSDATYHADQTPGAGATSADPIEFGEVATLAPTCHAPAAA